MSKISKDALVQACLTELTAYLRAGEPINQSVLADALQFEETNIEDLDRLLDIHFVLSPRVREYVERLPQEIRRISTTNVADTQQSRGDIQGAIDWGRTTEARTETGLKDRTVYVTRTQETSYATRQNLVLKSLLEHIHRIVEQEISELDTARREDSWPNSETQSYNRLLETNVHLNRIPAQPLEDVTPRMIDAARKSRKYLYYEAAALLELRQRIQDRTVEDEAFRSILEQTLAAPKVETLFELFCTFRMIRWLQSVFPDLSLRHIRNGNQLVEFHSEGMQIDVYHNSTGALSFTEPIDAARTTPQSEFLHRKVQAHTVHARLLGREKPRELYRGRPDIVIECYNRTGDSRTLQTVLVGEAKHSATGSTVKNGVLELLEYLMYARYAEQYLSEDSTVDVFGFVFSDSELQLEGDPLVTHVSVEEMGRWN